MKAKRTGPVGGGIIPGAGRPLGPIKTRNPHLRRLFEIAKEQGIGNTELAKRSGYTLSNISHMRNDAQTAMLTTFTDIAQALGYDVVLVPRNRKN